MLLSITTTHKPASDLSYLLHKHPDRFQSFNLSFGNAHVFYPTVSEEQCTACLLLDVDPVGMVRGKGRQQSFLLDQYVNDRPYVASSFMSVALSQVLGSALNGRCKDRPELVSTPLPLTVQIAVLPVRGGEELIREIFEPLGYEVVIQSYPLDELFPDWGESPCYTVTLTGTKTLAELLNHLYVLIPVFDNRKHYFVGENELEKLLEKGAGWLADHPLKDQISRRYLKFKPSLYLTALARLVGETEPDDSELENESEETAEDLTDKAVPLNQQRLGSVMASLRASGAQSVLDLGCGEGKLLRELLADRQFEQIVGLDISVRSLEIASKRLKLKRLPERQAQRIKLLHGSLTYRDRRLEGFDAAALVEVIEHLDPPRLAALERMLFEFAHPKTIVLTTPNKEYNVMWETLPAGNVRHADHRFEWTRAEFQTWAAGIADKFGYSVRFLPVGPEDKAVGAPTQMGVFEMKKHTDT
ncbi:3' terminal RNA ribose 2'-O-methyltransferase Hen1 [Gimesia sp.]|uniref:3' terminal RNA ribose 2'-O-methyltransferase Hen1 n=1 Tax=Gimesia sp. TaxID=2024833 RepID=UPI000C5C8469|nr:3' terminal RNA ribose 2'-O-methyltransferase Hen1 [Gimesia sp.]MAX40685.1 3' terminal RNA ribose 2'-O-methyltransferase Hen1 [Gimesia sp.]